MAKQPRYMSSEEKRLAKMWRDTDKESVAEIARRLHRNESSLWDFFGLCGLCVPEACASLMPVRRGEACASSGLGPLLQSVTGV